MLSPRFHPCVSVPARDRLFTADDLRRHTLLLEGATFLAPRSFLAAAHRCSSRHFLASRHSSGGFGLDASGSTAAGGADLVNQVFHSGRSGRLVRFSICCSCLLIFLGGHVFSRVLSF